MAFKRPLPEWNNPGIAPPQIKKDMGWLGREKPPAQWHNWFQHLTYEALKELQASAAHVTFGETEPASPDENDLWVDTSEEPPILKRFDGTRWMEIGKGGVSSVNGKTGDVVLTAEDVGAETPAGAQAKANTAEANAKAYTDAHEQKAAPHSGHETPAGAQAKADAALAAAKQYTDQEVAEVSQELDAHKGDNVRHITAAERATWNGKQDALGYTPVNKSGDTMTGILTAYSNTSYTVRQVRNIILSNQDADLGAMQNGDIWIKYK